MLQLQTLHPLDLADADVAAWREMTAGDAAFASPLLGPDFARAVGLVRPDARVAIWRREGTAVGFLPHHVKGAGLARPIGAPLSDYHALVSHGALDAQVALAVAGLGAFRFTGLIDPKNTFDSAVRAVRPAYVIRIEESAAAYLEALRAQSPKRFKNYRRLQSKVAREVGELSLCAPDNDLTAFEQLIAWKREQLARTGAHDFLAQDWTRRLMENLFRTIDGDFRGLMITLRIDGRLVAGHFGVRLGDVYHPWIASTDPEMGVFSVGQLFLLQAIAAMPALGLKVYDLGPGHDHYKAPYALEVRQIAEGTALAAGSIGWRARLGEGAWRMADASCGPIIGRVRRRFETISDVELTMGGRLRGVASAVAAKARRNGAEIEG
ncbi:GNAT family N-acetyltransferase [Phenylobacterium sp.]|uniref:GNAT family N-acetyltransferase n=1 Tax=Phenylobacterium sp. TaxID=1871053 RepID=UPI00272FA8E7|nr:GNAT family N-acetyltransferase [Phenylobacterium sp.]MDP2212895.1 GNAT family N-acetyltransferase [Phenylobacterium sp.]